MKNISSRTYSANDRITVAKAVSLMKTAHKYKSKVFISKEGMTLPAQHLASLVSFFLTLKKGESFLVIAEGSDADAFLDRLQHQLQ
ncbi:HPr family phosphocarrier protein [Fictibacillus iocasae]|uniref:HPr family phosphocarrier protein n=1 Tax=Fictibacillus iocasae TaxID=2715437 RepID=A0ABW2NKG4_9BACL